jgi:hypothetical protein
MIDKKSWVEQQRIIAYSVMRHQEPARQAPVDRGQRVAHRCVSRLGMHQYRLAPARCPLGNPLDSKIGRYKPCP